MATLSEVLQSIEIATAGSYPRSIMLRCPIRKAVAIALTALACAAGWSGFAATSSPGKGDPAAGKKIFLVKCVACHKADGSGGVKLTGNATPNWRDAKRMADPKFDDDYLRDCITNGKTKSGMVAWKSQIKPADIENLIAHIRSFAKK